MCECKILVRTQVKRCSREQETMLNGACSWWAVLHKGYSSTLSKVIQVIHAAARPITSLRFEEDNIPFTVKQTHLQKRVRHSCYVMLRRVPHRQKIPKKPNQRRSHRGKDWCILLRKVAKKQKQKKKKNVKKEPTKKMLLASSETSESYYFKGTRRFQVAIFWMFFSTPGQ